MSIIDDAKKRYSTKKFDANKTIPAPLAQQMKQLLQLSASSVNSQPWHFVIAETQAGKENIATATSGASAYNRPKILEASHVIVFCACTNLSDGYVNKIIAQEAADGRYQEEAFKAQSRMVKETYVAMHRDDLKDVTQWATKQVYLSLGSFLLGVGVLGLDAVPMEGFDSDILDEALNLPAQDLKSVVIVAVGYRAQDDFNAALPKSRLPLDDIITII